MKHKDYLNDLAGSHIEIRFKNKTRHWKVFIPGHCIGLFDSEISGEAKTLPHALFLLAALLETAPLIENHPPNA